MSNYKEEIIEYFTKKDNFISGYEIYQIFPEVKKAMVEQFWGRVKVFLEELNVNSQWQINISNDIFATYSNISVRNNNNIWVAIEQLHSKAYYGIKIDFENKKLNRDEINRYATKIKAIADMKSTRWWLGWKYIGDDFNEIESLKKILPENRDNLAQEFAKFLFDFALEVKEDISIMSNMLFD